MAPLVMRCSLLALFVCLFVIRPAAQVAVPAPQTEEPRPEFSAFLLTLKEQALAKTAPANAPSPGRYRPDDRLLAFLNGL